MFVGLHVKCPLFLPDFKENRILSEVFQKKNTQTSNFTKIRPEGAELYHADGQTHSQAGTTKLVIAFHNFSNAPKNA
jgi:hypothetical protein